MSSTNAAPFDLSLGSLASMACLWEATAAKPGNVNRSCDFEDLNLVDFLNCSIAVGQAINDAVDQDRPRLGDLVLEMGRLSGPLSQSNANLGICLLLAPLALAAASGVGSERCYPIPPEPLRQLLKQVLQCADVQDTRSIYAAIAASSAGGLGQVEQADVHQSQDLSPDQTPLAVMQLAGHRDSIASEYVTAFEITFERTLPVMGQLQSHGYPLHWIILGAFLDLLGQVPDTLVARKLGVSVALQIQQRAWSVRQLWWQSELESWDRFQETKLEEVTQAMSDLDFFLRCDGHSRNPGTTADLVAAGLFAALLTGVLPVGSRW